MRDIIVNLARRGGASKFSGKIEEFLEVYLVTETGSRTVPFGGRDKDIALLDAWLDEETAPPRYLLTAPAGRGKSALLVRWLQHLQEQGRVGRDTPVSWHLVFVPISIRCGTHSSDTFYEAIAARLAEILGEELPPTQTAKDRHYADHCRTLASVAVATGRRILIVLDGIDEALDERFDIQWVPRNPGISLRLVLSARWLAGDLDSLGWQTRLGWERDVRVQSRELPVLAREDVQDLLIKMGAPIDVLASRSDIVGRLHDLAEGEPLVLRYYAEDIWGMGEAGQRLTIDDLAQIQPGFGAYFERWLTEQEHLWGKTDHSVDRRRVETILAILACAHGRLTGADLRALLTESGDAAAGGRFLEQLKPIQRFVIGLERTQTRTAGYILSHPKLGIHLREEHFDPEYIQVMQAAFVRWGRKTVARLNRGALGSEETPESLAYRLQYHTQHLWDVAVPAEVFLELVEQGWLHAWERFEGGYHGFSRDIRLAYEALSRAHAADQPRFAQRLRCQLVLSSIHSIGVNTPWKLLVAAFKAGVLTYRQVAHWLEFKPATDRADALGELAPHLPAELSAEVLAEALRAVRAIEDSSHRAQALDRLVPHLSAELSAEALTEALTAVRAIEDSSHRTQALGRLAPYLPAELLTEALTAVRAIEDSSHRTQALGALAPHLPMELLTEALTAVQAIENSFARAQALGALAPHLPAELLTEALTAVQAIEGNFARTQALGRLAPHLPAELLTEALTAAWTIEDSSHRAQALGRLAPHLPAELGAQVLTEALRAARAVEDSFAHAQALGRLAPHLPAELGAQVLTEALRAARAIEGSYPRARVLSKLMPHLPVELLTEALRAARAIGDSFVRARVLGELAPHLPVELLTEALTAARAIEDSSARAQALGALAPHLPAELLTEALTVARAIEDSSARARALGALAPHLPVEQSDEVLTEALRAARAIEDSYSRACVLGELAPHLSVELLTEALRAARAIENSYSRACVLGALAPHLPVEQSDEVLTEALRAARAIEDSYFCACVLGELAPHLSVELLTEALTVARAIEDSYFRARVLGELAPHLPAEQSAEVLAEALRAARTVEDSSARARALSELAPQLSGNLLQQGFEELLDVLPRCGRDESLFAVSSFFPFLEECQGPEGLEEVRRAIVDTSRWFP